MARAKSTATKALANSQPTEQAQAGAQSDVHGTANVTGAEIVATVNAADNKPPANKEVPVLVIRTKRGIKSFRRAGHHFTRGPNSIAAAELSEDQLEALHNEPRLEIEQGSAELTQ